MKETAQESMSANFRKPEVRSIPKVDGALLRQRGAIAIMTALLLPVLIGIVALAIELGRIYNRKAEMQSVADAIAISAAKKLNGTSTGIDDALAAAHDVVESGDATTTKPRYQYGRTMTFSEGAIQFAKAADGGAGGWMNVQQAKASASGIAYVRVNTDGLGSVYGTVDLLLMRVLANFDSVGISHTTIAGRQRIKLMPFAICEMSKDTAQPFKERLTSAGLSELTEYGFRRGVGYNLMRLSPYTGSPVIYTVDPISLPPKSGSFTATEIAPYMCTGTVELPKVIGEKINVQADFKVGPFVGHLNSRFDLSGNPCNPTAAPPDSNTKQFTYATNNWMTNPGRQVAKEVVSASRIDTVADVDPPAAQTSGYYGPLWTFARAVQWTDYKSGETEPAQGYLPFDATSSVWNSLYATAPGLGTYPTDAKTGTYLPPYFAQVTVPPTNYPGVQFRRVLNVPLLECSAAGTTGKVVAIGRFFMTVPADANGIYTEFAGVMIHEEIANAVELLQ
jgi:Flp pilus assembly protein TadG